MKQPNTIFDPKSSAILGGLVSHFAIFIFFVALTLFWNWMLIALFVGIPIPFAVGIFAIRLDSRLALSLKPGHFFWISAGTIPLALILEILLLGAGLSKIREMVSTIVYSGILLLAYLVTSLFVCWILLVFAAIIKNKQN